MAAAATIVIQDRIQEEKELQRAWPSTSVANNSFLNLTAAHSGRESRVRATMARNCGSTHPSINQRPVTVICTYRLGAGVRTKPWSPLCDG